MNNCPNCGSKVNQGEAFCRVCGTRVALPQNNIANNTQPAQPTNNQAVNIQQAGEVQAASNFQQPANNMPTQNYTLDDAVLIDSYSGKNAAGLKEGFSLLTFFFGLFYVLYRKMWLLGFIWFTVNISANLFLSSLAPVIKFLANIIIAFRFKSLYLKHVKEQVNKIKAENPDKTTEQLMLICNQKGGTTIMPVVIITLLYFFLGFVIASGEDTEDSQYSYNNLSTNITTKTVYLAKNDTNNNPNQTIFREHNIVTNSLKFNYDD